MNTQSSETQQTASSSGAHSFLQPYLDFWGSYFQQATATTQRMLQSGDGVGDPRIWQQRWMEATSQSMESFMRSPQFLRAMKQNMDAAIQTKMQVDRLTSWSITPASPGIARLRK